MAGAWEAEAEEAAGLGPCRQKGIRVGTSETKLDSIPGKNIPLKASTLGNLSLGCYTTRRSCHLGGSCLYSKRARC